MISFPKTVTGKQTEKADARCLIKSAPGSLGSGSRKTGGFTLIEVLVVVVTIALLYALITVNYLGAAYSASLGGTIDTLVSDLRRAQLKAMTGQTEGNSTHDRYGIRFGTTSYTLFRGTYNAASPANLVVNLGDNIRISADAFPNSEIIFAAISGEVEGFVPGSDNLTLRNTQNGAQYTLTVNRYGTVESVN